MKGPCFVVIKGCAMGKSKKVFADTEPLMEKRFGKEVTDEALEFAHADFELLCEAHSGEDKAVKVHTVDVIYPVISLYRGLQAAGVTPEDALAFMDYSCSKRAESEAKSIQVALKIPGAYKLMPKIFTMVTKQSFGEAAGFKATFYPVGKKRVKFDMTKCLYCDVCRDNGVPELTQCFCHTDDVKDGHMHPKLRWNRTKVMGEGADVCDFDLIVED